jgi:hypothetical protein
MKQLMMIALMMCSTLISFEGHSQEKFTTYNNKYGGNETYNIQISSKDKDKFTLYIDAMSLDRLHSKGGMMIDEKQHQEFLNAISESKIKYEEWVKTAKENNIKELDKSMTVKSKVSGYFLYGDWNFQYVVNLTFDFKVLESKGELKYLLIIRTGELQSSSNQFMKVDGFVLVFSSVNEIDNFTNEISTQKINEFINKPKSKDLFKD